MCSRERVAWQWQVCPRVRSLCQVSLIGRDKKKRLWSSSHRPTGMLTFQMRGTCSVGSRWAEKNLDIWDAQEEEKDVNLGLRKGGGDEATTTSVRNARDWQFKTGLLSTHRGGAAMSVMSRAGEVGRRPCLARRSTWLFMSSSAWACVQEI